MLFFKKKQKAQRTTEPPKIEQITPGFNSIDLYFEDPDMPDATHTLCYRKRGGEAPFVSIPLEHETHGQLCRLSGRTEYEFYIERDGDGVQSATRLARTGAVPGRVLTYLHPEDPYYGAAGLSLSAPALCRAPWGPLFASVSVLGTNEPLTLFFSAESDGGVWQFLSRREGITNAVPFVWEEALYLLATDGEGRPVVCRADREGRDTEDPTPLTGITGPVYPMGMVETKEGLLFLAGTQKGDISCTLTLQRDVDPMEGVFTYAPVTSDAPPACPMYAGVPAFPLSDGQGTGLGAIVNRRIPEEGTVWNLLSLYTAPDGIQWTPAADILDARRQSPEKVGFRPSAPYAEDGTLFFLSATAYNEALSACESNYITLHTVLANM